MPQYVTLDQDEVDMIGDARDAIEQRIGKATDPSAEMVWRDVHRFFTGKVEDVTKAIQARAEVLEYYKKAEHDDVKEMLEQEFQSMNERIGQIEDELVELAGVLHEAALHTETYDEDVHGVLRQFVAGRLQEKQQQQKTQQMAELQQQLGGQMGQ